MYKWRLIVFNIILRSHDMKRNMLHDIGLLQISYYISENSSLSGLAVCNITGMRFIPLLTTWLTNLSGRSAQKHQI